MKIDSKHIAAVLAASAMAFGVAQAQQQSQQAPQPAPGYACPGTGPCAGGSGGRGGHMGDPAAFAEQRLSQFKAQLKITPQQEPLWQAFAEKAKAGIGQMKSSMRETMGKPMTAPERMDAMLEGMKARVAAMESTRDSFKRLYDALTPEQKATADKFHPFHGDHGQKRGSRGGMGPGGMQGPGAMQGPGGMQGPGPGGPTSR